MQIQAEQLTGIERLISSRVFNNKTLESYPLSLLESFSSEMVALVEDEKYRPADELSQYPFSLLLRYIYSSHEDYNNVRLPYISQVVSQFEAAYAEADEIPALTYWIKLYREYCTHLHQHIAMEEEFFFPYVKALLHAIESRSAIIQFHARHSTLSIRAFIDRHHREVEVLMEELLNRWVKLEPEVSSFMSFRVMRQQLDLLNKDIHAHEWLEENVLVPQLLAMEEAVRQRKKLANLILKP